MGSILPHWLQNNDFNIEINVLVDPVLASDEFLLKWPGLAMLNPQKWTAILAHATRDRPLLRLLYVSQGAFIGACDTAQSLAVSFFLSPVLMAAAAVVVWCWCAATGTQGESSWLRADAFQNSHPPGKMLIPKKNRREVYKYLFKGECSRRGVEDHAVDQQASFGGYQ